MDKNSVYDVIVVGAGIEGSSTAYQLAKRGKYVLMLEQFPLPHIRGSSHGQTRVTRSTYTKQDLYSEMMKEAYILTKDLESEYGQELFINCGYMAFGPEGDSLVTGTTSSLINHGVPHDTFSVKEQKLKYPFMSCPDNYKFVFDKSGGVLMAQRMLQAYQSLFVKHHGVLHDGEAMVDIYPGQEVSVKTTKCVYRCKTAVLAMGPWAAKFLPLIGVNVPLEVTKIAVPYWKEKNKGEFDKRKCPTFMRGKDVVGIYGLPSHEYPGMVKICPHIGPSIDPDARENVNNWNTLEPVRAFVAKYFPTLEKDPSIVETCIYTRTPDRNFILDLHPKWKNIVIGAGFSGHGFKLSPVVGKILADLATGNTPTYDLSIFRIDRFFKQKL